MKTKRELAGALMVVVALAGCGESETEKRARAEADAACEADIQCLGSRLTQSPEVGLMCGDQIERLATHDVTWTATLLQHRFSRARWTSGTKRSVTLSGDQARFQNAFGANVNMVYECDIDPAGSVVFAARAEPGRL